MPNDRNLTRVKLAKAVYLCDTMISTDLKTNYERDVAGPLDHRFFYNEKIGINKIGVMYEAFKFEESKRASNNVYHYRKGPNINLCAKKASPIFKADIKLIDRVISLMEGMTPAQSELFATLYACWNDLILSKKKFTDGDIVKEFKSNWHEKKTKYPEKRLRNALKWMKQKKMVPTGSGKKVSQKKHYEEIPF